MPRLEILVPKATKNYVKNPSFRNGAEGWNPAWDKVATFEKGLTTPNPTGFDSLVAPAGSINGSNPIVGKFSYQKTNAAVVGYGVLSTDSHTSGIIEFYVDPSKPFNLNNGSEAIITRPSVVVFYVYYGRTAGNQAYIKFHSFNDANAVVGTTQINVDDLSTDHFRIEWSAASAPGANDGFVRYYRNGELVADHTGIDNDTKVVTDYRFGIHNITAGAVSGSLMFDEIHLLYTLDQENMGSIAEVSYDEARFGFTSLKVSTYGFVEGEGVQYRVSGLSDEDDIVSESVYAKGEGRVRLRLHDGRSGKSWVSKDEILSSDRWTRLTVVGRSGNSNDIKLYVETADSAQAVVFYIDGAQLELQSSPTTFCDGDQKGCRWNGEAHNSISERFETTRAGGEYVTLVDEECKNERNLYFTLMTGFGMPPSNIIQESLALRDGSIVQGRTTKARTTSMTFHVKNKNQYRPIVLAPLHKLRQQLIDYIKPDLVPPSDTEGEQPFVFRYTEGGTALLLEAFYDSGLEESWDVRNQWTDTFNVRFLSANPFFIEDTQESQVIDIQKQFTSNAILRKREGEWDDIGYPNTGISRVFFDQANSLVYGRSFPNGDIYQYDGENWETIGTPNAGAIIYDMDFAPNGDVYVGGFFSSISGVAANNIAKWDGVTWSALGTGANLTVQSLKFNINGDLYIGGAFSTLGGATHNNIGMWDGSSYHAVGQYNGLNGTVNVECIVFSKDGKTGYVGGIFTDEFGSPGSDLSRIAQFDVSTRLFSAMDTGFDNGVNSLAISESNLLYAGGAFTTASGAAAKRVAVWNGSTWQALADGVDRDSGAVNIQQMAISKEGLLYVAGAFDKSGDVRMPGGIAVWNGSIWSNVDIEFTNVSATDFVGKIKIDLFTGDIYVAHRLSDALENISSGINVVDNIGSSIAFMKILVVGSGKLKWIQNITNGATLFLNYDIADNEELIIDTGEQEIVSSFSGIDFTGLLSNSDLESFLLYPDKNKIAFFMTDDVDAIASMVYTPIHWSIDGVEHG